MAWLVAMQMVVCREVCFKVVLGEMSTELCLGKGQYGNTEIRGGLTWKGLFGFNF